MVGVGVVIVMHIILGWALLNGLARKVVEVVKGPIETKIIEEVKPPPPPPPENLPPPPKLPPPPPAFMPPPEVQIQNPPPAPAITVQTGAAAAGAAGDDRAAAGARAAPPAPPAPPARVAPQVNFNTDCAKPAYPPAAARAEARAWCASRSRWVSMARPPPPRSPRRPGPSREHKLLDRAAEAAIRDTCKFKPGTVDGKPEPLTTFVEYVWKLRVVELNPWRRAACRACAIARAVRVGGIMPLKNNLRALLAAAAAVPVDPAAAQRWRSHRRPPHPKRRAPAAAAPAAPHGDQGDDRQPLRPRGAVEAG